MLPIMFNTEDLISEIEKQPAIWNTAHDDYNNKNAKKVAWEYVVKKFTMNFDDLNVSEKNNIVLWFQRKWKSLRDCFTRELLKKKKGKSRMGRKQYIYFKNLSFLQSLPRPVPNPDEEVSLDIPEVDFNTTQGAERPEVLLPQEPQKSEEAEVADAYMKKRPNKTKRKDTIEDDELFAMLRDKVLNDNREDDDRLFMLSLVPELKRIPESAKLDIKIELMNVFKRAKFQCSDPLDSTSEQEIQSGSFTQMPHLKPMVQSEHPWCVQPISERKLHSSFDFEDISVKDASCNSSDHSEDNTLDFKNK